MTWDEDVTRLREGGFSWDEIKAHRENQRLRLVEGGFDQQAIDGFFGKSDPAELDARMQQTADEAFAPKTTEGTTEETKSGTAEKAKSDPEGDGVVTTVGEAWDNGWQLSASGLVAREQLPDELAPENMGIAMRIAQGAGILAGDLPFMIAGAKAGAPAGAIAGGAIGTAVAPGPGTAIGATAGAVVGGGAGAFALPTFVREQYMDALQNGWAEGPGDFVARQASIMWKTSKSATVGAVTAPVGALARAKLTTAGLSRPVVEGGTLGAELVTMTTMGAAVEGHLPSKEDFIDGAILLGGLKGATAIAGVSGQTRQLTKNLQEHFRKTGEPPKAAAERAVKDPVFREEMVADNAPKAQPKTSINPVEGTPGVFEVRPIQPNSPLAATQPIKAPPAPPAPKGPPAPKQPKDAQEVVLDRIGRETDKMSVQDMGTRFMTEMVDNLHPIKQLIRAAGDGKKMSPEQLNAENLLKITTGSGGRAEYNVQRKMTNVRGEDVGPGLMEILPKTAKGREDFKAYAMGRWAVEKQTQRKKTGVALDAATQVVRRHNREHRAAFDQLQKFQNQGLQNLLDAGLISQKKFDNITNKVKAFIPAYRVAETAELSGKAGTAGGGKVAFDPVRAFEGSTAKIADPYESIIKNQFVFREVADRNRANVAMVDLASTHGLAKKNVKVKPTALDAKEIEALAKKLGLEKDDLPPELDFSIFRPAQNRLAKDEILIYREGKPEVWQLKDAEAAQVIKGLDTQALGMLDRVMQQAVRFQRGTITLAPSFPARQFFMDTSWGFIVGKGWRNTLQENVAGLGAIMTNSKPYNEWLATGGANSTFRAIEKQYVKNGLLRDANQTALRRGLRNVVTSPFHALRIIADTQAAAPRVGRFIKERQKGAGLDAAQVAAKEVTIDFARQGTIGRRMNAGIPFFGAFVNAMERTMKAQFSKETAAGFTAKATAAITIPALTSWWLNKDQQWYQEANEWEKDNFLLFRTGGDGPTGTTWRIPFPPAVGLVYAGIPRRLMEKFVEDNPDAGRNLGSSIAMGFFPPGLTYATLTPFVEHMANHSFFRGTPLVADHLQDGVLAPERYSNYTTESARQIALMLDDVPLIHGDGLSPAVIENYVRGWAGTIGASALQAGDAALEAAGKSFTVKPSRTLSDIPFLQSFTTRYPSSNTASISEYYERTNKLEQTRGSIKKSMDERNFERWEDLMLQNSGALSDINAMDEAMTNSRTLVNMVFENPDMSPDDKRQLLDQVYGNMIMFARTGNDLYDELGVD